MAQPDTVTITDLDPADDEALHAAYGLLVVVNTAEPASPPIPGEAEVRAKVRSGDPARTSVRVTAAHLGDRLAGVAIVSLPHEGNRHTAFVGPFVVDPGLRRRGVGRVLLDAVCGAARADGRTVLLGLVRRLDPQTPSPGQRFAEAVGATLTGRSLEQVVDVAAVAEARTDDATDPYEVLDWTDTAPGDLVEGWARLRARMSTDTPADDRPDEPEVWDTDRVRDSERRFTAQGRTCLVTAARHRSSGDLVAYTMVSVARDEPRTAYQEDTLVAAGHRGHGLGLRLKRRTLARLAVASPATVDVLTWNSSTNTAMLAVNAALGHRVQAEELRVRLEL